MTDKSDNEIEISTDDEQSIFDKKPTPLSSKSTRTPIVSRNSMLLKRINDSSNFQKELINILTERNEIEKEKVGLMKEDQRHKKKKIELLEGNNEYKKRKLDLKALELEILKNRNQMELSNM